MNNRLVFPIIRAIFFVGVFASLLIECGLVTSIDLFAAFESSLGRCLNVLVALVSLLVGCYMVFITTGVTKS